jgi:ABC-type multidrug transport system fused ATPase/permease subunit
VLNLGAGETDYFIMPATVWSVVVLIADAVLFGILAWYLDAVFPGNHGIPRKWYFPFDPRYWWTWERRRRPLVVTSEVASPVATETTPLTTESTNLLNNSSGSIISLSLPPPLLVSKLKKNFKSLLINDVKCAVNGLSLSCGEDEIFALLGHNGAGKSTTINMLTGLLAPTSGDAKMYGLSIKRDMDSIRNILGVCPQHNILWDDLTAREHMRMFALLKGIGKQERKKEVKQLLENVQLDDVSYVVMFLVDLPCLVPKPSACCSCLKRDEESDVVAYLSLLGKRGEMILHIYGC